MRGFGPSSYGDAFADVFDDWYADVSDVGATVRTLARFAAGGPVLELGVGTGRLALPLAETVEVHGVDASAAMLARLRAKPGGDRIRATCGDMATELPPGPYPLVFVAYNTLFNLLSGEAQRTCFATVASRLVPGGRFAVETFVPEDPPRSGSSVDVKALAADRVVLDVARYEAGAQRAEGQFVELTEAGGVRLRPWAIRWATPAQLDDLAAAAGLALEHRWAGWDGAPFTAESDHHVTIYRLPDDRRIAGVG